MVQLIKSQIHLRDKCMIRLTLTVFLFGFIISLNSFCIAEAAAIKVEDTMGRDTDWRRVILRTGFEKNDPAIELSQHRIVDGIAKNGNCSLLGEKTQCVLYIPFEIEGGRRIKISFWINSNKNSACAIWVNVNGTKEEIFRLTKIPKNHWEYIECSYPVKTYLQGEVQIVTPFMWEPADEQVWIDDLQIVEIKDECDWPVYDEDFGTITFDESNSLWIASIIRSGTDRFIKVSQITRNRELEKCRIAPKNITGIGSPAIAGMKNGCLLVFPVEQDNKWRLAYIFIDNATVQNPACRYINCKGSVNISPAITILNSKAYIVWESNADGLRSIYSCRITPHSLGEAQRISSLKANSYNPDIISLKNNTIFAVWDSIQNESADIFGAFYKNGKWQTEYRITSDVRIERHPSLSTHKNEIWLTWQAQSYSGIRLNYVDEQRIAVAKISDSGFLAPKKLFTQVSTQEKLLMRPEIAFDSFGRLWLAARQSIGSQAGWKPVVWCYSGDEWSKGEVLSLQQGRWQPIKMIGTSNGCFALC